MLYSSLEYRANKCRVFVSPCIYEEKKKRKKNPVAELDTNEWSNEQNESIQRRKIVSGYN